jgi:heptose I phosphotransferase
MRGVAYGQRGSNPAARHSFIVTEELAPTVSLEDFCRNWPQEPPPAALKQALIGRAAGMAGRMHRAGVNHRDFYICHFLLHLDPAPTAAALKLSLIDLHRAQLREKTPSRWRDKDLASLYFSALNIGLTRRDRLRFLRGYFAKDLRAILRDEEATLTALVSEADRLQARFLRKFSPGAPT